MSIQHLSYKTQNTKGEKHPKPLQRAKANKKLNKAHEVLGPTNADLVLTSKSLKKIFFLFCFYFRAAVFHAKQKKRKKQKKQKKDQCTVEHVFGRLRDTFVADNIKSGAHSFEIGQVLLFYSSNYHCVSFFQWQIYASKLIVFKNSLTNYNMWQHRIAFKFQT